MRLQKLSGFAAIYAACSFIFVIAAVVLVITPARLGPAAENAAQRIEFMAAHQGLSFAINLVGYILFGIAMTILSLGLFERLRGEDGKNRPASQLALGFGMIWSGLVFASGMIANIGLQVLADLQAHDPESAPAVFHAYRLVVDGLGGGNEIVGGLWLLCICLAMWGRSDIPKAATLLTGMLGVVGIVTTLPPLAELSAVFGIGLILWYLWIAVVLLRSEARAG